MIGEDCAIFRNKKEKEKNKLCFAVTISQNNFIKSTFGCQSNFYFSIH